MFRKMYLLDTSRMTVRKMEASGGLNWAASWTIFIIFVICTVNSYFPKVLMVRGTHTQGECVRLPLSKLSNYCYGEMVQQVLK